jgi:hypothetical protein
MTDYGLTVANFSSFLSGVPNGCQFIWEGDCIIFPDKIVDIASASVWTGKPYKLFDGLTIDIIKIKHAFLEFAAEEGLSPVITKKAGNLYSDAAGRQIAEAVKTTNIQGGSLIDLSSLIGLGPGFTPSGDDFLAGVMLYEALSGINLINRESIEGKLFRTTAGGKTLLMLALRNSFPFYLKQFAESICISDFSPKAVIRKVIMHGSTSGSDSLAGFLWAQTLNEPE